MGRPRAHRLSSQVLGAEKNGRPRARGMSIAPHIEAWSVVDGSGSREENPIPSTQCSVLSTHLKGGGVRDELPISRSYPRLCRQLDKCSKNPPRTAIPATSGHPRRDN